MYLGRHLFLPFDFSFCIHTAKHLYSLSLSPLSIGAPPESDASCGHLAPLQDLSQCGYSNITVCIRRGKKFHHLML